MATYGIARVSDKWKQEDGPSIDVQVNIIQRTAGRLGLKLGGPAGQTRDYPPGIFADIGESAYRKSIWQRPEARRLLRELKPGDVVIVARIDRLFRAMSDFCKTTDWFKAHGIRLIVAEPELDFGSACGRLLAHLLAAFAEFESSIKSERVKAALASKGLKEKTNRNRRIQQLDGDRYVSSAMSQSVREKIPGGRIWIYRRVSSHDQAESERGLLWQQTVGLEEADRIIEARPQMAYGGEFVDAAVSARNTLLRERPEGSKLCAIVKPGDIVIFPRLDRGFRSTRDMLNTVPDWISVGIEVRIVDQQLDFSKWTGMVFLEALSLAARIESEINSARKLESNAWLRSHGRRTGPKPFFMKTVRCRGKEIMRWDEQKLAVGRIVVWLRKHNIPYEEIGWRIHRCLCRRDPTLGTKKFDWKWSEQYLRTIAKRAPLQYAAWLDCRDERKLARRGLIDRVATTAVAAVYARKRLPAPATATGQ